MLFFFLFFSFLCHGKREKGERNEFTRREKGVNTPVTSLLLFLDGILDAYLLRLILGIIGVIGV